MLFRQWKTFLLSACIHFFLTACLSSAAETKESKETNHLGYSIHVGAYSEEKNAERLASKLQAKGTDAFYFKKDNGVYAVRVGDFPTLEAARKAAKKLAADKVIGAYFIANPSATRKEPINSAQSETEESRLVKEAKRIEKKIKTHQANEKFYAECTTSPTPVPHVVCNMFFPEVLGNMRYVHNIEAFTLDMAKSFAREYSVSFEIYALMKDRGDKEAAIKVKQSQVKGDFIPVCAYAYWKEFDKLETIWPQL